MAKKQLQTAQVRALLAATLTAALVFVGCSSPEEEPEEAVAEEEGLVNIGVRLAAPGLISGTNPDTVSGAEVELAVALSQVLELTQNTDEIAWVPTATAQTGDSFGNGRLDLMIGQLTDAVLDDEVGWVGPYVEVEPAFIVRIDTEDDEAEEQYIASEVVETLEELQDASVCVVADSLADAPGLPAGEVSVEQTVTACATGMRSGRFDAIAADDAQLGGLLADSSAADTHQMVLWSQLVADSGEDDAIETSEQPLESGAYWIGTSPDQCAATADALSELVSSGVVEDAFDQLAESTDYEPQFVAADDITTTARNQ